MSLNKSRRNFMHFLERLNRWAGLSKKPQKPIIQFRPQCESLEAREVMTANPAFAIGTDSGTTGLVKLYGKDGEFLRAFQPYGPSFTGGVRVTLADLNADGVLDIVTAPGAGGGPNVRVYDGATEKLTASFFAYSPNYTGGVNIAAGDLGNGNVGIVTGTDGRGGPHVKAFAPTGQATQSFFAYGSGFLGGVKVALGYGPTGDAAIFTGAGAGAGAHVKAFDIASGKEIKSFLAYGNQFRGGVSITTADFDGDGISEIVTTPGKGGAPHVKIFDGATDKQIASFYGGTSQTSSATQTGVVTKGLEHQLSVLVNQNGRKSLSFFQVQSNGSVASVGSPFQVDGNSIGGGSVADDAPGVISVNVPTPATGTGLIAAGTDKGDSPLVKVFEGNSFTQKFEILAYPTSHTGGVRVAIGDVNGDGTDDIITGLGGSGSQIKVFNGLTGAQFKGRLGQFNAFGRDHADGVYVASGDVNGDGYADIVVGSDGIGKRKVRAFSGYNGALIHEWDVSQTGMGDGIRVAVGDVNGDGKGDIVVAGGPGGNSRICVFDGGNGAEIQNYFAFESTETSGIQLATGDVNGDGRADVIAGEAEGGTRVRVISGADTSIIMSKDFFPGFSGGVRLAAADTDKDGKTEVIAATGPGEGETRVVSMGADKEKAAFSPFGASYSNGLFVSGSSRTAKNGGGVGIFVVNPSVSISTTTPDIIEGGNISITLTRTGSLSKSGSGTLSFGGTATSGSSNDFTPTTDFSFDPGQESTTISIPTTDDSLFEGLETVVATISTLVNGNFGTPTTVTIGIVDNDIQSPSPEEPICTTGDGPIAYADGVSGFGSPTVSGGGVSFFNGSTSIPLSRDLLTSGYGKSTGASLTWSNQPGNNAPGASGNNLVSPAESFLKKDSSGVVGMVQSGKTSFLFDPSGGNLVQRYYSQNTMAYSSGSGLYTLTDTKGNKVEYYDFSTSLPSAQRGQIKRIVDTAGNTTDYTYNGSGQMTEYQRATTVGSTTTTESFLYTYLTSGTNSGKVDTTTLRRKINSGSWDTVRSIQNTYYGTGSSNGNAGDLKLIETKDSSGNVIDTQYMRYYTSSSSTGYVGGLKYLFNGPSYDRLKGVYSTPDSATDSQISGYADAYYEYSSTHRVTKAVIQGDGCPVCTGGLGEYDYTYTVSAFADGYNNWRMKTVETLPDGNQNIVYTNFIGETILSVFKDVTTSQEWPTYSRYDSQGRLILTANPSAVDGYDETKADLLDNQSGDYQHLRNSAGLITNYAFGSSTTATTSTAGNVSGYLQSFSIQQGETGTPVPQQDYTYIARTANSQTTYWQATSTQYRNTDGTGGQTTSNSYTWVTSSQQVESITTTLPTVTTAQNGPNSAASSTVFLDAFGRVIWKKDALGYLTYNEYDQGTGALTKTIQDVDTTQTSSFSNLPIGWSTPSGAGLHLVTTMEIDSRGRTTKLTYPNGRVDYTVYKDSSHEVRQYKGWDATNLIPTGPIIVSRQDWTNGYNETLSMSATPSVTSGRPNGTESMGSLESLKRMYKSIGGQVTNDDAYFDLTGLTYSTSTTFGTENTNFYRTSYRYDHRGRKTGVVMPTGTIYRIYLDGLGRKVSEWVGLDDTPTTGLWSPSNTTGTDLVKVKEFEYDSGGIGDSTLTKSTKIPGGSAANRVTQFWFDWRNRNVVTKSGVETSESTDVNRPITYLDYDNLNEVTKTRTYDGDGVSITTTSGVPNAPSSSLLRAQTESLYDEQNRVYRTLTYSVSPSDGSVGTYTLAANSWYDNKSQVIKTSAPGGVVTKYAYDGLGRTAKIYATDGGGDSGWSDAANVSGDLVLQQSENTYDSNSHVILITTKQHNHDDLGTGELGIASTGNKARVSYILKYYDGADRLSASVAVGTNGGSSYTRPGSVPSRSDTALVNSYAYATSGLLQDTTDPKGLVKRNTYDNLGRVTKTVEDYTNGTITDTSNKTTEFTYNSVGRTSLKVDLPSSGQQTTSWIFGVTTSGGSGFNSNDLVGEVDYPDPSTGASSSSSKDLITSNTLGQKLTVTDRNGNVQTYSYNTLDRQTSDAVTTLGSGVDGTIRRIETTYDTLGNTTLVSSYDAASGGSVLNQVKKDYNGLGQVTKEWQEHSGAVTGSSANVQYTYSEMASGANHSRLTTMTYASGYVVNYNYGSGLDSTISRLTSLSDSSNTLESYTYLGLGTVVKRAHPQSGVDLSYIKLSGESTGDAGDQYTGLDRFGRIVDQRWINASNADVDRFRYGYDRDGNRTYKENVVNTALSEVYTYDDLSQISTYKLGTLNTGKTDVTGTPTNSQSWDYDATGNWDSITTNSTTQTRSANKQNEITSVSGGTTPTYDNNGNLTKDENNYRFVYDAWNRQVIIKNASDAVITTNAFNGMNQNIKVVGGSSTIDRIFSTGWQDLEEKSGSNTVTRNVWSPAYVDALVLRDRDTDANGTLDERLFSTQDANYNVTTIVNTSGTVQEKYTYTPFGVVTYRDSSGTAIGSSTKAWVFLHQGGQVNIVGDYDFRNRVLSPTLGRWLTNDPLGFEAGDINLYRYEINSPIEKLDFNGLKCTASKSDKQKGPPPIPQIPGPSKWGGNPETLCELAKQGGLNINKQTGRPSAGGVICYGGNSYTCFWDTDNNLGNTARNIYKKCIIEHENDHHDDIQCSPCGNEITRPGFSPGIDGNNEECKAFRIEMLCYLSSLKECKGDPQCEREIMFQYNFARSSRIANSCKDQISTEIIIAIGNLPIGLIILFGNNIQ